MARCKPYFLFGFTTDLAVKTANFDHFIKVQKWVEKIRNELYFINGIFT